MNFSDAFRAQYFLGFLEKEMARTEKALCHLTCFSKSLSEILREFSSFIAVELDQLVLPAIVFEIDKAKRKGILIGKTPQERYVNFFVDGKGYTKQARFILERYPFLLELIDRLIRQTFDAFVVSLKRYRENQTELTTWLQLPFDVKIQRIQPLDGADRHCCQQALLFIFSNGFKVIYKPIDLRPDILFGEFVQILNLEEPFDLKAQNILSKSDYGWIRYIERKACQHSWEVENFYRRAGVLLSVADALNYTDGHCENLIADGALPILIDGETFFQNYEQPVIDNKNILTTLLVQKINNKDENRFLNSALQAPSGIKHEYLQIHAIQDHTDEIKIRYCGINPSPHHHCPLLMDEPKPAYDYVPYIIEGYSFGYDRITKQVEKIFNNESWWEAVGQVKARILLRETLSYVYLLRKIQQPEVVLSRKKAESFLFEKLGITPYSQYEMEDLLDLNIPYFYHIPSQRHLYDGKGNKYSDVFGETAIVRLKKQFLNRSDEKKCFDCEILSRHLIPSFIVKEKSAMMTA